MPAGLLLAGLAVLEVVPAAVGIHAMTAGAMGSMTVAVMTRATLGHTGRPLRGDIWTAALYLLVAGSTITRIAASLDAAAYMSILWAAAALWSAAFLLFVLRFGKMLAIRPGSIAKR